MQQIAEAPMVEAPTAPTLSQLAEYLRVRSQANEAANRIRENTEALIHDLTLDLQNQIRAIREREEAKVAEEVQAHEESRDIADRLYREGLQACIDQGVMEEGRYQIVNRAKVDHPINIERFKATFPAVFEQCASVKKTDAVAGLMTVLGVKKAVAEKQLDAVCDDVPAGPPVWEFTVKTEKKESNERR
jgi:hypothetical protein